MSKDNFQKKMAEYIFFDASPQVLLEPLSYTKKEEAYARLSIYKNNTLFSLSETIIDLLPSVEHVVGRDFLKATAREYLLKNPPTTAILIDIAIDIPEFLLNFKHTKDLKYLSDLAKIDIFRQQSYHACDEEAIDSQILTTLDPGDLVGMKVDFLESCHMLESNYRVGSLWEGIQSESMEELAIDGTEHILIYRHDLHVKTQLLSASMFHFIHSLTQKKTIGDALEETLTLLPDTNIPELISTLFTQEIVATLHKEPL